MQFFGLAAVLMLVPAVFWGLMIAAQRPMDRQPARLVAWVGGGLLVAAAIGCAPPPATWPLPTGLGGVFGDMILSITGLFSNGYPSGFVAVPVAIVLAAPAVWLMLFASGLLLPPKAARNARKSAKATAARRREEEIDDEDEEDFEEDDARGGWMALGAVTHWWLSARSFVRRHSHRTEGIKAMMRRPAEDDGLDDLRMPPPDARQDPAFSAGEGYVEPGIDMYDDEDDDMMSPPPAARTAPAAQAPAAARVDNPAPRPKPGQRIVREAQPALIANDTGFEMPALHFLAEPKNVARDPSLSKDALEQNARLLEGVLEDFGVKGEIIHVRPGPVVTLYELEPAPGIKSSRVIGLADDIARSMSAIACRVAVVPGRNAIGIELPNVRRETVYLRELLASRDFEQSKAKLTLALGKTINGEAVVADIAKMPHLLVAGTTGSRSTP
jgi:DNA segregation ATPase FtsK/SpoIIIE, S-DNA-T family